MDKERTKKGPAFDNNEEITPQYEAQVHSYYGLSHTQGFTERGAYGEYQGDEERLNRGEHEGTRQPHHDLEDKNELKMQRVDEELVAGTRECQAGGVRVRKRVRTDREQLKVPKRQVYILGPIIGGVLAAVLYDRFVSEADAT